MSTEACYILGLNLNHGSTAALLKDGEVLGAVSEERFCREKNRGGIPVLAIQYLLELAGIGPEDLQVVTIGGQWPTALMVADHVSRDFNPSGAIIGLVGQVLNKLPGLEPFYEGAHKSLYQGMLFPGLKRDLNKRLGEAVGNHNLAYYDHHDCHAAAALYGFTPDALTGRHLIFTHDSAGDGTCSSVSLAEAGRFKSVGERTPNAHSPSWIYSVLTDFMGMKILEHEYKLMGLAPYADQKGVDRVYPKFRELFSVNQDLSFGSKLHCHAYGHWMRSALDRQRFDWIAGAAQRLMEDLLIQWVNLGVEQNQCDSVVCGGGVFMNVKANMHLGQQSGVKQLIVCPTAGDESTAIGAAYLGYRDYCDAAGKDFVPQPVTKLYLGPEYDDAAIEAAIQAYSFKRPVTVEKPEDIEARVAQLLADGKVVARFAGRAEWGARALGNRSILAHPGDPKVVKLLNEQIKSRDFWMPFAGSMLAEDADRYLVNPKGIRAQFMELAFETRPEAAEKMPAALHPYDSTIRPQVVQADVNPSYHRLISLFKEQTGIGAVLNTSFNLHGEPIVNFPADALHTLDDSGLKYLAIGGFLVKQE
ncbi:MAG: carbamoyltransferase C-terminal domain-containing protein [bacterium]|nr:carbamoyltransferase C-terminal domain-containing protein [bacterium]